MSFLLIGSGGSVAESSSLAWISDEPLPTFYIGTPATVDLDAYTNGTPAWYAIKERYGVTPTGFSLSGARNNVLNWDGAGSADTSNITITMGDVAAEVDFAGRADGAGVVWYHDFETDAEVDAFRWTGGYGGGNDPLAVGQANAPYTRRITSDGIRGYCMEIFRPAGNNDGSGWWRPFSPLTGGGGKGVDDPADGSTLRAWSPTDGGSQTAQHVGGYYGNSAYHAAYPGYFDGTEYYISYRVKMSAARWDLSNPDGGKVSYFTRTDLSNTNQEINVISRVIGSNGPSDQNWFSMYRSGSPSLAGDDPSGLSQVGGEYNGGSCRWYGPGWSASDLTGCWAWPQDEWVTLKFYVKPGLDSGNDTIVRVWTDWNPILGAKVNSWIKIWDQTTVDLYYLAGKPFGQNALILTAYMNGAQQTMATDIYHRYCEVIFSHQDIACPQV